MGIQGMTERLEIDVLRTLKAVADHGGITRAAEFLSLSQSAVSHKIRRFEQNLSCQILRRKSGQGLFTEDGQHLLCYAEKIIRLHDEALSGMNRPLLKGRIRLGITEEMVTSGLSTVLGRFARLFPGVRVKTEVEQSLVLDKRLQKASLDMVVMQIFKHDLKETDVILRDNRLVWVKSVDYDLPNETRIPFIAFDQDCFYRNWAVREFAGSPNQLDVVLECASNEGVCSAVMAGMGVALIAQRHLRPGMEKIDIAAHRPPDLVFVIRTGNCELTDHLTALRKEIMRSLAQ